MGKIHKVLMCILVLMILQFVGISGCSKTQGESSLINFWFTTFDVMVDLIIKSGGSLDGLTREEIVGTAVDIIRDMNPDSAILNYINLEAIAMDVYDFIYQAWIRDGFVSREADITDREVMVRITKL